VRSALGERPLRDEDVDMVRFGAGLATGADVVAAAERATWQAVDQLGGQAPDLVCVFVCGDDPEKLAAAGSRASEVADAGTTLGCTAGGVIGAGRAVEAAPSVSVWAGVLDGVRRQPFHLDTTAAGDDLAVIGTPPPIADDSVGILLADPYSFPVDGFLGRSHDAMPGLPLVGGLASGSGGPGSTRLFLDDRVVDHGAVGVLLGKATSPSVAMQPLVSQGCRPVGRTMAVTRAEGNQVMELAGAPALMQLQEIAATLPLEDQALLVEGLHIGLAIDEYADAHEHGDFLIRAVLGGDAADGAMTIGDLVEVGSSVRFHVRDAEGASADLIDVLGRFRRQGGVRPVEGALLFAGHGRGAALFPSADHDAQLVGEHLTPSGVAGFFAAGEIGPVAGRNYLHGFTASMLAFGLPAEVIDLTARSAVSAAVVHEEEPVGEASA